MFKVYDLENKFQQGEQVYDLDPQLARQHMESILFKFIFAGDKPWNFEKGSFFTRIEPERFAMKQKWEKFLGEKLWSEFYPCPKNPIMRNQPKMIAKAPK